MAMIKFVDINDDSCLIPIMEHLSVDDLLNIVESSKWLKNAVNYVYKRKYGGYVVVLRPLTLRKKIFVECTANDKKIYINGLLYCLKFLRCFGHLITNLQIVNRRYEMEYTKLVLCYDYVMEYCNNSLQKLTINNAKVEDIINLQNPFTQIEELSFNCCDLGRSTNLTNFNEFFPKMRRLEFNSTTVWNEKCITAHFPLLEHLKITPTIHGKPFTEENVKNALELNLQLRSFHLYGEWNRHIMRTISFCLESLEILTIDLHSQNKLHDNFQLKNLKKLKINFDTVVDATYKSLNHFAASNHLEELILTSFDPDIDIIYDFIQNHSSIIKLVLAPSGRQTFERSKLERCKGKLSKVLTSLQQINLITFTFGIDEAVDFVKRFKSLTMIRFILDNHINFDVLRKQLISEWNATMDAKIIYQGCVKVLLERNGSK